MRHRLLVALGAALAFQPVAASAGLKSSGSPPQTFVPTPGPVRVTAGEHDGFSRVVFALGVAPSYRAEPEQGGLRVVFADRQLTFDYQEVYPKGRAHRVAWAEPRADGDGTSFYLGFNCECIAKTFVLGDKLVVDVFDARHAAREGLPRPDAQVPGTSSAQGSPAIRPALSRRSLAPRDDALNSTPAAARQEATPRPEFMRRVNRLEGVSPEPAGPDTRANSAAFDADKLRRMLERAIDQGQLSASSDDGKGRAVANDAHAREPRATTRATSRAPDAEPTPPAERAAPEKASGTSEPAHSAADAKDEVACPDPAALDLSSSAGQGSFAAELSARQAALGRALATGEDVQETQLGLARFYLARLMPQEAIATLETMERSTATDPIAAWLQDAALLLADRVDEIASDAWQSPKCANADLALWRTAIAAARGTLQPSALKGKETAARLAAYPEPLRIELGLRLAEASLDANALDSAEPLLEMVSNARLGGELLARLLYAKGRLAAARGDFAGARRSWRQARKLPGEGGVRAMLALLQQNLTRGEPVEPAATMELARLAFDWRGHPLQLEIARLTAELFEKEGRPAEALGALEQVALLAPARPNARAAARLATNLLRSIYANREASVPTERLGIYWRFEGFVPPGLEGDDIRFGFARALMAHDLPGPAADLLEQVANRASGAQRAEVIDLLAEARIRSGEPAQALDLLQDAAHRLDEMRPGRNLLAARALAALGGFAEAAGVLSGSTERGALALMADYLWDAGMWREAVPAQESVLDDALRAGEPDVAGKAAVRLAASAYMAGSAAAPGA
ncbi:MAG: hypothetical protein ACREH6_15680, partial [Geminicoccaceae bacterium]